VLIFSRFHHDNAALARPQGENAPSTRRPATATANNRFVAVDLHGANGARGYPSCAIFFWMSF
jgi:hypothetical protein